MPRFILAFYGGAKPQSKEEGAKQMQNYKNWLNNLGDSVEPGMPLGVSKVVSKEGIKE